MCDPYEIMKTRAFLKFIKAKKALDTVKEVIDEASEWSNYSPSIEGIYSELYKMYSVRIANELKDHDSTVTLRILELLKDTFPPPD